MQIPDETVLEMTMTEPYVLEAMNKMAFYMYMNCKKDGKFVYRVNTEPTIKHPETYNVLRHAGAIYALALYGQIYKSTPVIYPLKRAIKWMKKTTVLKMKEIDGRAIFTTRNITNKNEQSQAKLGATALGILALLEAEKFNLGIKKKYLRTLCNFLCWMQKEDGSFYSKYFPVSGRDDSWTSQYYSGQTALALSEMKDERYAQQAINALRYLALQRRELNDDKIEADHWSLLATASIFNHHHDQLKEYDWILLKNHVRQIMNKIINDFNKTIKRGRTCPIATRLEGLLYIFPHVEMLLGAETWNYIDVIQKGIRFLLTAYRKDSSYVGGITREYNSKKNDERSTEIRIDYVQHTLCALMNYHKYFFSVF